MIQERLVGEEGTKITKKIQISKKYFVFFILFSLTYIPFIMAQLYWTKQTAEKPKNLKKNIKKTPKKSKF